MKHRPIGFLLLILGIALGGCAPPDAGASGASTAPNDQASHGASEPAAPVPTEDDEY